MNATIGRTTETDYVGEMKSINFYFAASADEALDGSLSKAVVDLHIDLTAQGDPGASRQIAGMLSGIGGCTSCITMARNMNGFIDASASGTVQLSITIPSSAYGFIAADPIPNSSTPSNTVHDQKNWDTFVQTADDLNAWPLSQLSAVSINILPFLKSYAGWQDFNKAFTGASVPNRNSFGNSSSWPQDLLQITDPNIRQTISYSILAGQYFMNLCDSLQQLAGIVDVSGTTTTWNQLVNIITTAAKDYVSDFARPIALSLIWLCGSGITSLSGPSDSDASTGKFQVKLSL
jgi:hypothetical protein